MVKFKNHQMKIGENVTLSSVQIFVVAVSQSKIFTKGLQKIRSGIRLLDLMEASETRDDKDQITESVEIIEFENEDWNNIILAFDEVQWAPNILNFKEFWKELFKIKDGNQENKVKELKPA